MQVCKADLHVHTVLSPCGDLNMSPDNIIREAKSKNIDILAITDHNTTKQNELMVELGRENGIFILPGCEVNSKEEVHCLAIFENIEIAKEFQNYLDKHLPFVPNNIDLFGHQVVVNRSEQIIEEEEKALFVALDVSIYEIEHKVHELNGLLIPSHIERKAYGLLSQLGFVPDDLKYDALEISYKVKLSEFLYQHPELKGERFVRNSDAHLPEDLGRAYTLFEIEECSFNEVSKAIRSQDNRKMIVK